MWKNILSFARAHIFRNSVFIKHSRWDFAASYLRIGRKCYRNSSAGANSVAVFENVPRCENVDSHNFFLPRLFDWLIPQNLYRIFIGSRKLTSPLHCAVCVYVCICKSVPIHTKPNANQMQKDIFSTFVAHVFYVLFSIRYFTLFSQYCGAYGFVKRIHLHRNRSVEWVWIFGQQTDERYRDRDICVFMLYAVDITMWCVRNTPQKLYNKLSGANTVGNQHKMELYMCKTVRVCKFATCA